MINRWLFVCAAMTVVTVAVMVRVCNSPTEIKGKVVRANSEYVLLDNGEVYATGWTTLTELLEPGDIVTLSVFGNRVRSIDGILSFEEE